MRRKLPAWTQPAVTLFTGKAYPGQSHADRTATYHLLTALTGTLFGLTCGFAAFRLGGWWLIVVPVGWAWTLHGVRNLRMMIYHQCAHRNMWRAPRADRFLGRVIAGSLVIQNFNRYGREHVSDHHASHHMTMRDPTVQAFLLSLRLAPGMTRTQMWRRLLWLLSSPRFHLRFAVSRARSFAQGAHALEWVALTVVHGTLVAVSVMLGPWWAVLLVWYVPLVPFFQISNTLRLCVKHTFPPVGCARTNNKEFFAGLTNAIFLGEQVPGGATGNGTSLAWVRWTVLMLAVHAPARFLVLTGDTVVHDYHHRYPNTRAWPNYLHARADDDAAGHLGWPPYREVWGLGAAISMVFDSLGRADATEYDAALVSSVTDRELFAAFDD